MPETAIVVPARLQSVRFPRKLLAPIHGVPLILLTARRIAEQLPEWPVYFAVAEQELADVLASEGFRSILTDPSLPSGTDRIAAANDAIGARYVLNVQADEPLVSGAAVRAVQQRLQSGALMATIAAPFQSARDHRDPNKVKVVLDASDHALYFSRAPIPHARDAPDQGYRHALWHLGLYGYEAGLLQRYAGLPQGPLEALEKLEQLRALEHGIGIAVSRVPEASPGVDTPEDAAHLAQRLEAERDAPSGPQ